MDNDIIILTASFFCIALIYASVGFGGGSSYLALLAIMGVHFETIRPTALICNIIVVTVGTYIFYKEGELNFKKSWPFIITSIPLAFLGGIWKLQESTFFIILGMILIIASLLLWIQPHRFNRVKPDTVAINLCVGGGVGLLSGLVGIGGGIFLSPILHLMKWGDAKKISALASLFILVNSISGLAGQLVRYPLIDWNFILPLALAVFLGGQVGSRLGALRFNPLYIKRITALLILIAGINILKDNL
jgi:uncharacterized membrane protein YfcA